ncbi:ImmA/IrrE family metallo-endopeptidase [Intrasporangium flavum]|uniref:ImmA/IrrE family metallo-endopeptidase n=1 Tax=Intrasporangium flavum TaxID=1428657 RepID=UPI00310181E7
MNYARRVRMTFAHELAHIVIPWHVGYGPESCTSDVSDSLEDNYVRTQENEARNFAGRLLLPYSELARAASGVSLQAFLDNLDRFEASAWATTLRLTQILRSGFIFGGNFTDSSQLDVLRTPGTRSVSLGEAQRSAVDEGTFTVGGRDVQWFQLTDAEVFAPSQDPRKPSEIIKSILFDVYPAKTTEERDGIFYSTQGMLGAALSQGVFDTPDALLRQARHRLKTGVEREIRSHVDWDAYVLKTVENRARKLGLL